LGIDPNRKGYSKGKKRQGKLAQYGPKPAARKYDVPISIVAFLAKISNKFKNAYGDVTGSNKPSLETKYARFSTPNSLYLYPIRVTQFEKDNTKIVKFISYYMLPFRTIQAHGIPVLGFEGWVYVKFHSSAEVRAFVERIEHGERPSWKPVPEIMRRLPQVMPKGVPFTGEQTKIVKEIASLVGINPKTISRKIHTGKPLDTLKTALLSPVPFLSYRAEKRNINERQLEGKERMDKENSRKIGLLADTLGVSKAYLQRVARGQRPIPKKWSGK
jgi:hypothetical protein